MRTSASRSSRFATGVAVVVGVILVAVGVWAMAAPRSFFDTLAMFEPYNHHFLHDLGAFQIGLGAVLLLAVRFRDALFVALVGVAVGTMAHVVSHALDVDLGGAPARDIPLLALMSVALIAGAVAATRRA